MVENALSRFLRGTQLHHQAIVPFRLILFLSLQFVHCSADTWRHLIIIIAPEAKSLLPREAVECEFVGPVWIPIRHRLYDPTGYEDHGDD